MLVDIFQIEEHITLTRKQNKRDITQKAFFSEGALES